jgi:glucose-6-phosphate dehydrogenase assembly protein OpcA
MTPLVALQKPKEISVADIEAELSQIWHSQTDGKVDPVAVRASTFSMVVYTPDEFQQLLAALGFYQGEIDGVHGQDTREAVYAAQKQYGLPLTGRMDAQTLARLREEATKLPPEKLLVPEHLDIRGSTLSDAIAIHNPCRIITLCPVLGSEEGVTVHVSAYCPIQKMQRVDTNLICCEYITLKGSKAALNQIGDLVSSLMIPDLPKFVWWKATPNPEQELFQKLSVCSNALIVDSSFFSDPELEFAKIEELLEANTSVVDLNWHRISAWQELTAEAYDPPERRADLIELDQIAIDYEKGNPAQAFMFLGWIASRLGWQPVEFIEEGGDYDLKHVHFKGHDGRAIAAELAAIPVADVGEVIGDLTALRLTSTNATANCCTILCSETTGCMRMEAGGSAHACRTEQVSAINDQKAEFLLGQQLQRWGRDMLYEESLAVVAQILKLVQH